MGAPIYEHCSEINNIIKQLIEQRTDLFGEMAEFIFPEMFVCGLRSDKPAPKKQKSILKLEGIRNARTLLSDKKYLVHGYKEKWDSCSHEKKIAAVANILRRVDYPTQEEINKLAEKGEDFEYGKTRKPDIEDFSLFIKNLGLNWNETGTILPDLLTDKSVEI